MHNNYILNLNTIILQYIPEVVKLEIAGRILENMLKNPIS